MKRANFILLVFCIALNYGWSQGESPGLEALYHASDFIVQGIVDRKLCSSPTNISSIIAEDCLVSVIITDTIKGSVRLSPIRIQQLTLSDDRSSVQISDTVYGVSFEFTRFRLPAKFEDTSFVDYNVQIGDAVILFLNEKTESQSFKRVRCPDNWYLYALADRYLGIITANDYVVEFLQKEQNRSRN